MERTCACGKAFDGTVACTQYRITQYNDKGKLIFAVCNHNVVTVDTRVINMKNFLSGNLLSQEVI